jgi:hypothetical protein
MKPEKQRIAIAEACGWKDIKDTNHESVDISSRSISYWSGLTGVPPEFIHYENRIFIPDYLNDLNAMHQAEKVLTKNKSMEYAFRLADSWILNGEDKQPDLVRGFCATAAERAEAFLKTIGKWEDEA